jgi:DNA-binding helix-turn-helix protein
MVSAKVVVDFTAIKEMREQKGLSLSDLSLALGYKTTSGYWLIERGQRKVFIDTLYRLAKIYGCHMEELLTENPNYTPRTPAI